MFSKAVEEAKKYTRPVVGLVKLANGEKVETWIGTYVHIDDQGHILSARHIYKVGSEDPIVASALLYDCKYSEADIIAEDEINDLILLRIKEYRSGSTAVFPKFFKSSEGELPKRTPIVRLGYPMDKKFSQIAVTWDETIRSFNWDEGNTHLTCLADNGFLIQYDVNHERNLHHVELNSPASIGQSGGPILTVQGAVAGLQSKNSVFDIPGNKTLEIGVAASHVAIARFLEKHPVAQVNWLD